MKVVACIPARNEEATLPRVLVNTFKHVDKVIVCSDGSTDATLDIAKHMGALTVDHPVTRGYGRSLIDLFKEAMNFRAKVVVTLDADGQHDPNDIPAVVKPILEGRADIVIGSRFMDGRGEIKKYREFGINIINLFVKTVKTVTGERVKDSQCGLRAYSANALKQLHLTENGMGISTEILLKAHEIGLRIVEVPVHVYYQGLKPSSQNPISHGSDVVGAVIRRVVERYPLKYFGASALVMLVVSIFFTARTFNLYISTGMLITNYAVISMFTFMFFVFLMNMAITLYALSRIRQQIEGSK